MKTMKTDDIVVGLTCIVGTVIGVSVFIVSPERIPDWVLGLGVSILCGHIFTELFLRALRACVKIDYSGPNAVFPWIIGMLERLLITMLISLNIQAVGAFIGSWIMAKAALVWKDLTGSDDDRKRGYTALLATLISVAFAVVGGAICTGELSIGR
jgi:hypothetical protein